ncbi:hypothetical protein [Salinigranum salinum]|uniref:hypothetical protein n=1 Tax=Salinigranum salinum TaxID=1364937 RepID=UPI001261071A|nr:hypothetical protein [Salinigranum salinum]
MQIAATRFPPSIDSSTDQSSDETVHGTRRGSVDGDDDQGEGWGSDVVGGGLQHSLLFLRTNIPANLLALWAALEGAAELYALPAWAQWALFVLAVVATPIYVYQAVDRPEDPSDGSDVRWWREANVGWQSILSTGAFVVWVYFLGGPFQAAGLQNADLAILLVLAYPIVIVISPYYGSFLLYQLSQLRRKAA